jgi:predicted NodU family carbamoyl transferase
VLVVGFSGIHNGEYYREHYGLRFVGHKGAVALVRDGKILFAAEEEHGCPGSRGLSLLRN